MTERNEEEVKPEKTGEKKGKRKERYDMSRKGGRKMRKIKEKLTKRQNSTKFKRKNGKMRRERKGIIPKYCVFPFKHEQIAEALENTKVFLCKS